MSIDIDSKRAIEVKQMLDDIKETFETSLANFELKLNAIIAGKMRNCLSCDHFSGEKCALVGATPPPIVIVKGCEKYEDEIPF